MPDSTLKTALAIDIGGTRIKVGLVASNGRLLQACRLSTPARSSPEHVIQVILSAAHNLCHQADFPMDKVEGIGVSIAAFITAEGVITASAHLSQDWVGYDMKSRLLESLDKRYYFALDVPASTLGEAYYGAGKGVGHFAYVTVSTGIGAGIMADGQYYVGGLGWAGGIGHTIIDETSDRICSGCGNAGCLETFAATQGIVTTARELLQEHPESLRSRLSRRNIDNITPKIVFEAAQKNDPIAQEVFFRTGHALGIGLTNLADIVAPTKIIVGGGIAQAGELLLGPAREVVQKRSFPPKIREVEIVQAKLSDLSGVYGAAAMVFHNLHINPT